MVVFYRAAWTSHMLPHEEERVHLSHPGVPYWNLDMDKVHGCHVWAADYHSGIAVSSITESA